MAEETFLKALTFKSDLADSNFYLGQIYEEAGKTELARKYYLAAKNCTISRMNTVTEAQVEEKYAEYSKTEVAIEEDNDDVNQEREN
jgi:hypothetical protein